jgi:hypothetical protein
LLSNFFNNYKKAVSEMMQLFFVPIEL